MPSRPVAIVLSTLEVVLVVIPELFLQGKSIKLSAEGKLPVNLSLANVEVLHVEEPNVADSMLELLDQFLLTTRLIIER